MLSCQLTRDALLAEYAAVRVGWPAVVWFSSRQFHSLCLDSCYRRMQLSRRGNEPSSLSQIESVCSRNKGLRLFMGNKFWYFLSARTRAKETDRLTCETIRMTENAFSLIIALVVDRSVEWRNGEVCDKRQVSIFFSEFSSKAPSGRRDIGREWGFGSEWSWLNRVGQFSRQVSSFRNNQSEHVSRSHSQTDSCGPDQDCRDRLEQYDRRSASHRTHWCNRRSPAFRWPVEDVRWLQHAASVHRMDSNWEWGK